MTLGVFRSLAIAMLLGATVASASPDYSVPRGTTLAYSVEITPRMRMGVPWTGALAITVNTAGIISGKYRSNSVRPDPFYGKTILVSGGLTSGDRIRLSFGTSRASVKGTISDEKIVGTFYDARNHLYDFVARRVRPD